ncbi:MAG: hypothetical protein RLZZ460_386 [Chloroflexota bacterium]|jgi:hypothetical protein
MPVNSRTKGRAFEQSIARDLRERLGDGWTVERNQTDRQRGATGTAGEFSILSSDPSMTFGWCIECKAHKAWDEGQLWRSPVAGPLPGWWVQARRQASAVGLAPVLIAKRDRGEVLAFVRAIDWMSPASPPWLSLTIGADFVIGMRWSSWLSLARLTR